MEHVEESDYEGMIKEQLIEFVNNCIAINVIKDLKE